MSNQIEQIRAEIERRIKSWEAGVKYEGDAGDCQSRVTELTDLKKFIDQLPVEPVPADVQEAADNYEKSLDYYNYTNDEPRVGFVAGMLAERERLASLHTIKGWVARDVQGGLVYSTKKMVRVMDGHWRMWKHSMGVLTSDLFPSLRWEDEPKPVRVIIEEIKE